MINGIKLNFLSDQTGYFTYYHTLDKKYRRVIFVRKIVMFCDVISEANFNKNVAMSTAPHWYTAAKPWNTISLDGRIEMQAMRNHFETQENIALTPTAKTQNKKQSQLAAKGKELIIKINKDFGLDEFHHEPQIFGTNMVL
ncbi:MAG: hypothetical protein Q9M28_00455 [Mariprofundaceae bacterium]|nr:hypothetical protein [Mariprofundaceae bacterium]